jgi:hypothetical protein
MNGWVLDGPRFLIDYNKLLGTETPGLNTGNGFCPRSRCDSNGPLLVDAVPSFLPLTRYRVLDMRLLLVFLDPGNGRRRSFLAGFPLTTLQTFIIDY